MRLQQLTDIDWPNWRPQMRAAEVLVIQDERMLLIRKKRGLGAGKINGPGGRLEPGESLANCAVREVQEELGVTPRHLAWAGEHRIQFTDGLALHLDVFRSDQITGVPIETDEAVPLWTSIQEIPYTEMWEDTRIWFPWLLEGRRFSGQFLFDGDRMLDHLLVHCARSSPAPIADEPIRDRSE